MQNFMNFCGQGSLLAAKYFYKRYRFFVFRDQKIPEICEFPEFFTGKCRFYYFFLEVNFNSQC